MKHRKAVDVLVVGAGPCGMAAALRLGQAGLNVKIIDSAEGITSRSYGCGIHPGTLSVLDELGILSAILNFGHLIETISIYEDLALRAELNLADLPGEFRYAVALPQSELEALLEKGLERQGVKVDWNHRLAALDLVGEKPKASVDKYGLSSTGIIFAETTMLVQSEFEITADFVIGTDGADSCVRRELGIEMGYFGESETFTLCDFESSQDLGHEARVQIEDNGMELLWPLSSHAGHWIVQTPSQAGESNPTFKERVPFSNLESAEEKARFKSWAQNRAPWFVPPIAEIEWLAEACTCTRLATKFGARRCWLAGDSAHQGNPVGMHSFNLGLMEAVDLAARIGKIIKGTSPASALDSYNAKCRGRWESILRPVGERLDADDWMQRHWQRIASYLPASGAEGSFLLEGLGIRVGAEPVPV